MISTLLVPCKSELKTCSCENPARARIFSLLVRESLLARASAEFDRDFAPKGRNRPAQGNALGYKVRHQGTALKGRNKTNAKNRNNPSGNGTSAPMP